MAVTFKREVPIQEEITHDEKIKAGFIFLGNMVPQPNKQNSDMVAVTQLEAVHYNHIFEQSLCSRNGGVGGIKDPAEALHSSFILSSHHVLKCVFKAVKWPVRSTGCEVTR